MRIIQTIPTLANDTAKRSIQIAIADIEKAIASNRTAGNFMQTNNWNEALRGLRLISDKLAAGSYESDAEAKRILEANRASLPKFDM